MSLKILGKNAVIYAIGNVCCRAASFILIPLYTHALSMKEYGLLATLLISIHLMLIFTNMGMRTALLRFSGDLGSDKNIGSLLGTSGFINLLSGLIVTGITFVFLIPFFRSILHTNDVYAYVGMACCAAFLQTLCLHLMTYYRARNQAVKYMIAGILTAVILFLSSFFFLYILKLGISGALLGLITTHACILLLLSIDVLPKTGMGISLSLMPELVRFGSPIVLSEFSGVIMEGSGLFFLSYYLDLETVAIYSLGYKFANILCIVITLPFLLAFQPYIFGNINLRDMKEKISRMLTYLALATVFMAPCIFLGSRILLKLSAPPEYSSAFLVVLFLVPGIGFTGPISFGDTLLSAAKKTHILGLTMVACACLAAIGNYCLIPFLGWYGAAIALNVSFIIAGSVLMILGAREFPVSVEWKRIGIILSLLISFLLIYFIFRNIDLVTLFSVTVLVALCSVAILFLFSFFHKDEIIAVKNLSPRLG